MAGEVGVMSLGGLVDTKCAEGALERVIGR